MAGTVLPAIILSGLLVLGSLPVPGAAATPRAKAPPAPAAGTLLVVAVEGEAQLRGRPLAAGAALAAGDELRAGRDGHVRLKLTDDSTVSFWGPGSLVLDRSRALPSSRGTDTSLRLENGRIEAAIRAQRRGSSRFEVRTPVAVATTDGALFRLAAAQAQAMTCEVAEGSVQVSDSASQGSVAVPGGRGTRVLAGRAPMQPVALLPEPRLWTGIQLVEQRRAEIAFTPLERATAYRMVVSPGADLFRHLADETLNVARLRIAGLADGDYFVRVRGIDEFGLEGAAATVRMRVRVRPDPPSLALPAERARLQGGSTELSWLPDPDAVSYVAQLAEDSAFRARPREWSGLREPKVAVADLRPGTYHWRVASTHRDGTVSRFSAVRTFQVDAPTAAPTPARRAREARVDVPANAPQAQCLVEGERGLCAVYAPPAVPR
jgi:hypothetical protein